MRFYSGCYDGFFRKTGDKKLLNGEVVYIHPKRRYIIVERTVTPQFGNKKPVKLRECFKIVNGRVCKH